MSGVDVVARQVARAAAARAAIAQGAAPVYNRAGLAAWHAALTNRANAPARVLFLGDSWTEGAYAPTFGTRWVDRAVARLRQDFPVAGVTGGIGYLPALVSAAAPSQTYLTKAGGPSNNYDFGLGSKCAILNNASDSVTFAFTGTSAEVVYVKASGTGTMTVQVDGGTAVNVNTYAATMGMALWSSGALTAGAHTVKVGSTGGSIFMSGVVVYNGDEAAGVVGYEGGHGGWKASDWVAEATYGTMAIAAIQPQLAVIAFGTNEFQVQPSLASYRAALTSMIASLRTASPGLAIALVAFSRRGDIAASQPIGFDQYVRALYDVADADTGGINGGSGVAVIDLSARLPNATTSGTPVDALGFFGTDRLHPTAKGHGVIGEMVGRALGM